MAAVGAGACSGKPDPALQSPPAPGQVAQRPGQIRVELPKERSCREFVKGFYDWYFKAETSDAESGATDDTVLRLKPEVLSLKLRRMLIEEYAAEAKMNGNADLTLDMVPYTASQDVMPNLKVRKVTYRNGKCLATVWIMEGSVKYDLINPELVFQNGKWIFINFHYPDPDTPSDENLIDMLISLRKERARAKIQGAQP